ncbi:MAG: response regulator [Lachnospiraceae bacterium]|nr:response regulator [Lachnospiraceae bacterium]
MEQVLIVDDEEEISNMLIKCLSREGIKGIPCLQGQDALEKIKKQNIDLVILDIMMADMDGFEVLRHIREMDMLFFLVRVRRNMIRYLDLD